MKKRTLSFIVWLFVLSSLSLTAQVDLELSAESDYAPLNRYVPNTVIFQLTNNSPNPATNVAIALDLSDKTQAVLVGNFQAITSSGIFKPVPNLWQIDTLPPFAEATLEVQYFPLIEYYVPYAQVTAADQEDVDSTPGNGTCCTANEDDEATLTLPSAASCSFLRHYSNVFEGDTPFGIDFTETDNEFLLQSQFSDKERTLTLDKTGNLLDNSTSALAPMPVTTVAAIDSQLQLVQVSPTGDTLIKELLDVDYSNPTAIIPNSDVRKVSDGYIIGGFIVDTDAAQTFRAFFVKTDLNGQSPQTVLIEDLDNTFSIGEVLEDSVGGLYIFWGTPGNFSLSGTSPNLLTTWVRQFASDTPSTTIENVKLSKDEQTVYVAVTDNLRGVAYAYDTATGRDKNSSFSLFDILPLEGPESRRLNGILPLNDGNLLFSARRFFNNDNSFVYGVVGTSGQSVWLQAIEGDALNLDPIAETTDGGFLFASLENDLTLLKTNPLGERTPACNNLYTIESRTESTSEEDTTTIRVFPNPTSSLLQIKGLQNAAARYIIYDFLGRIVQKGQLDKAQLEVSGLASNGYILRIEGSSPIQFVKQ